jgi:hypothetical protein
MMHPTNEEWMSYLYDELAPGDQGRLKTHLEQCRECRERMANWRTAMRGLDQWELPAPATPRDSAPKFLRWGMAAMLLLGVGYGLARVTTPVGPDLAAVRAAMEPEIRRQIDQASAAAIVAARTESQRLVAELARQTETKQEEDRQAVADILQRLETKRVGDLAYLRKELETVAVNAEDSLESTQQQLVQLASFTQPPGGAFTPANSQK